MIKRCRKSRYQSMRPPTHSACPAQQSIICCTSKASQSSASVGAHSYQRRDCKGGWLYRLVEVKRVQKSKKARPDGGASEQAAGCNRGGQQSHKQQYSTAKAEKASIYDLLPVGAENAVSRRQLSAMTGIPDRQLRRKIADERKAGLLILSSTAEVGGGYFRAADTQELRRWVAMMQSHIAAILAVIRAAQEAIEAAEGNNG